MRFPFSAKLATAPAVTATGLPENRTSNVSKARGFLTSILSHLFPGREAERFHHELVDTIVQIRNTEKILELNRDTLTRLAEEGNEGAKKALYYLDNFGEVNDLLEKVLDRQELNTEEAGKIVSALEGITEAIDNLNTEFEVNLKDIIGEYQKLITDERLSEETRKNLIEEVRKIVQQQNIQTKNIEEFLRTTTSISKLDRKTLVEVTKTLEGVKADVTQDKMYATLKDINATLDKSVLRKEELTDLLSKPTRTGKTFKERFLEHPEIYATGREFVHGALTYFLTRYFGPLGSVLGELLPNLFSLGTSLFGREEGSLLGKLGRGAFPRLGGKILARGLGGFLTGGRLLGGVASGLGSLLSLTLGLSVAAFGGWKVGSAISKGLDWLVSKATGGKETSLGGWLYEKFFGKRDEDKRVTQAFAGMSNEVLMRRIAALKAKGTPQAQEALATLTKVAEARGIDVESIKPATIKPEKVTPTPATPAQPKITRVETKRETVTREVVTQPQPMTVAPATQPAQQPVSSPLYIDDYGIAFTNSLLFA